MRFHVSQGGQPGEQTVRARAVLAAVGRMGDTAYHRAIRERADEIDRHSMPYTFTEYLAPENHPCYLSDFLATAGKYSLYQVADTQLTLQHEGPLPVELEETSQGDWKRKEQYRDFLQGRSFRQSILARGPDQAPRKPNTAGLRTLFLASEVQLLDAAETGIESIHPLTFEGQGALRFASNDPYVKAALVHLGEAWPGDVLYSDLWLGVRRRLAAQGPPSAASEERFARRILDAVIHGAVTVRSYSRGLSRAPSARPQASREARFAVARGDREITNLLHRQILVSETERRLLALLDGSRDLHEIARQMPAMSTVISAVADLCRKAFLLGQ